MNIESVWSQTSTLPKFERLEKNMHTDILVIGGGIAGLLCTYLLREAGADVLLLEADRICGGVTKNTTAKITAQHGFLYDSLIRRYGIEKARLYWKANTDALDRYRLLCRTIDCDFSEQDNVVYTLHDRKRAERELFALQKIGALAEWVEEIPLPVKIAGAVKVREQAQFHPLRFLASIARELPIYENSKVRETVGKKALTANGSVTANKIIVATHFPILNKHGFYFLKLYQHRSYVLALSGAPDFEGMYIDESETGLSFRRYRDTLLLGGGSHRTGKKGGNWRELERFAATHFPKAVVSARWAAQDCMTLDQIPYIGQYAAGTPDWFVATGFEKWGMTTSMAAATILCDLVRGKSNPYASVFSPQRNILHPQLAVNAGEAVGNLLCPTAKRCPHLGCALKWNADEHSWDCPCHGSRFSENGNLIDNPATGDLK